jgi:hypothetical protein
VSAYLLSLVLLLLAACSPTVTVHGPTLFPARMPVRAFPTIWISGGSLDEEVFLQDRLAAHLADDGQHEVRRVDLAELEPARKAGKISATTVVILIDLKVDESVRNDWATSPASVCGYYGCYTQYQSYPISVPELRGEAQVTVYEGPTARVLQRERFHNLSADDSEQGADALLEGLAREIERSVDVLRKRERVQLYEVKEVPGVNDAVALIESGKWYEGRDLLERAKDQVAGEDPETQARVWFDLGLARWFAPGPAGLTESAYQDARRALAMALELEPHPVHRRVLAALDLARKNYAVLEEQRRATAHNYALRTSAQQEAQPVAPTPAPEATPSTPAP